jgi:D-ribulokinase
LPEEARRSAASVAIDGTSATALLVEEEEADVSTAATTTTTTTRVIAPPRLYNEAQPARAVAAAAALAGADHTAAAATSTLAKLLDWWGEEEEEEEEGVGVSGGAPARRPHARLLHQADWLASLLHGRTDTTDWNNALKVGFDPGLAVLPAAEGGGTGSGGGNNASPTTTTTTTTPTSPYPAWLTSHPAAARLLPPRVVPPGSPVGELTLEAARRSGLPRGAVVCAGTTDSIAAFLAAAGPSALGGGSSSETPTQQQQQRQQQQRQQQQQTPNLAVTSLGSTIAVKLLSPTRVDDAASGVYSHRLPTGAWLVGGASNAGGAVLRRYFPDDAELAALEPMLPSDPRAPPPAGTEDWYPLPKRGERFPVYDPQMEPRLPPVETEEGGAGAGGGGGDKDAASSSTSSRRTELLHGLLASLTRVERAAYARLAELGAARPDEVRTAGGGARNARWTAMREAALGVPVSAAEQGEAAYGAALLARHGFFLSSPSSQGGHRRRG